jgi:radical SAM superfamily enzyme YgiQ (UPF0313 family)
VPHALLVNPFYAKNPYGSLGKHSLTPALTLTSLAAATPPEFTVAIHDENLLRGALPVDPVPAVVGITVHLTFAERAYELAAFYRELGAQIVLGGLHVASRPEEAAEHADAVSIGDGTMTWPVILRDAAAGRLRERYVGDVRNAPAEPPRPRRDLLPEGSFLTTASVIATSGCTNRCDFCYLATRGLARPYRQRSPAAVVAEIESLDTPYVVFLDNNLSARKYYLRELCRALEPLGIIWSAAVSLDVTDDPDLVREMALSGCTGVFVGLETLNGGNLAAAHKRSPRPDDYARRVRILSDVGIEVTGSFVFGFDGDGPDVFDRTVAFIEENRLACATFHILTPYPGTPLFDRLDEEGRILTRDWSRYDTTHAVFRPARMSPEELEHGYRDAYRRVFGLRSIWVRRPERVGEALPYLGISLLYKRANRLWLWLIRTGRVHRAWAPLVRWSRWRHLRFREDLATSAPTPSPQGTWPGRCP